MVFLIVILVKRNPSCRNSLQPSILHVWPSVSPRTMSGRVGLRTLGWKHLHCYQSQLRWQWTQDPRNFLQARWKSNCRRILWPFTQTCNIRTVHRPMQDRLRKRPVCILWGHVLERILPDRRFSKIMLLDMWQIWIRSRSSQIDRERW